MKLEKYYYDAQLKNHGMLANATVIGFEETHSKSGVRHFATFKYKFEKRIYTQKISNENSYYKLGDSLRLTVSNNDPEIFSIIEVKKSTLY